MLTSSSRKTSIDTTTMVRAIRPRRLLMRISIERAPLQGQPASADCSSADTPRTRECLVAPVRARRRRPRLGLRATGSASPWGGVTDGAGCPLRRGERLADPDLVELIVVRRVLLQVVHLRAAGRENRAPQRQDDDRVVPQDLLDLLHLLASLVHVESAGRLVERLVELGIAVVALVPRHAGAV